MYYSYSTIIFNITNRDSLIETHHEVLFKEKLIATNHNSIIDIAVKVN